MNKKLIIIIAAVLVVGAGVAAFFIFGGEKELPYKRTEFTPGDHMVVNVKDSERLLKVTITLVLNTDTLEEFLTERTAEIRDAAYTVLRNTEEDALRAIDLSPVKNEIVKALNERLEIDHIIDILFIDYAIQ